MARKNSTNAVAAPETTRSGESRISARSSPPGIASAMVTKVSQIVIQAPSRSRGRLDHTTLQSKVMTSRDARRAGRARSTPRATG